ncbi:MFS general substrate transporter [Hypoxylon trugodes]|uniref:MFS general substrate transporter n=1 Tax=Hypoxylon trugodes TaxID=326681 RepID=UPI00219704A9|nr:MFS general substrate transporter [Hypoxylon trugodes]KAI1393285.1 MFS general substrate transporter [Hypoxylon trugodes]
MEVDIDESKSDSVPNYDSATMSEAQQNQPQPQNTTPPGELTSDNEKENNPEQRSITGIRWLLVCVSIFSANLLFGLDNTIAADIQGAVSETYNNTGQLGWLGVGFALGSAAGILPLGKAYGIFDNKWVFISCLTNFAAASALCGAAPNMNAMIVGRVWAGFGGAGMYLGTLNLLTALVLPKEQPLYVAMIGFVYGGGAILGPVVGGLLADSPATWRWGFYLNLVIFAVMAPIYLFLIPSTPRRPDTKFIDKLKLIDWLGILLNSGMYCCFTVAFLFGGVLWKWSDGPTIALIVLFGVFLIAFATTQKFCLLTDKVNRLFPCSFLRDPQLVLMYILMACSGGASIFVCVYYIPLYYLFARGDSGTGAAISLLPYICFYVACVLSCGAFMGRVGYHRVWFLISGLLLTAGAAAMYTVDRNTPNANIVGYTILLGTGMTTSQAAYAIGNLLVEPARAADVIQYINISQGSSQLIGLAIASAVFQGEAFSGIRELLSSDNYSDADIQAAIAGARSEVLMNASPEVRDAAMDVIIHAIDTVWILVIVAGALHTVCSLFLTGDRFVKAKGRDEGEAAPAMMIF